MDKRYGSTGGNLYLGDLINIPDLSSKDANSLYAIFDTVLSFSLLFYLSLSFI